MRLAGSTWMTRMGSTDPGSQNELQSSLDAYRNNAKLHADAFADVVSPQLQWLLSRTSPGDLVLDVGCGTGRDVRLLRSLERAAVGVDLVAEMLTGVNGTAVCDARVMPFADGTFDAVFSSAGLVHLDKRTFADAVCEMSRVGKVGAPITLSVRHKKFRQEESGWEQSPFGDRWYQRWNASELAVLADRCGIHIQEVEITDDGTRPDVAWVAVSGEVAERR
jgi:SAM-dependent methyltransferase